jgi:hypothetical protein
MIMIGQATAKKNINKLLVNSNLRFFTLVGGPGSGKCLLAKYIADTLNASYVPVGNSVSEVRETIELAYHQTAPIAYVFTHADKMSSAAKNSLLKVTEEPPTNAYFILNLRSELNTINTILSRSVTVRLDEYSSAELREYANLRKYNLSPSDLEFATRVCRTPGEMDLLCTYDIAEFKDYIRRIFDNIGFVNAANIFKIGSKLKVKADDSNLWDIELFLNAVSDYSIHEISNKSSMWVKHVGTISATSSYLRELTITGINKQALIDMWLVEMRSIWGEPIC